MPLGRYKFDTLFTYNTHGTIVPKYTTIINNVRLERGSVILSNTHTGGVNLFTAIGKDFAGSWDASTRIVTISGVYQ